MNKTWLKPVLIGSGLLLLLVVGARLLLGVIVGSAEFREITTRVLERSLQQVFPGVTVEVDSVKLSGLTQVQVANLVIRGNKNGSTTLVTPLLRVVPRLGPLFKSGLLAADFGVALLEGGQLEGQVALPGKAIWGRHAKSDRYEPHLAVEGTFEGISVAPLFALLMSGQDRPGVQLTAGRITGGFALRKPLGASRATGRKIGRIDMQILSPRWIIEATEGVRELQPANLDISVELQDFAFGLRQPLVFQDRKERVIVTGTLLLPKYAEEDLAWDLILQGDGSSHLQDGLARLLRCVKIPSAATFTVKGPINSPRCNS